MWDGVAKSVAPALIESGNSKNVDVQGIARIAGTQSAKPTSELIFLWHPITPTRVIVDIEPALRVTVHALPACSTTPRRKPWNPLATKWKH
jgi:molybdenum cofactor biosynthesis enzyme